MPAETETEMPKKPNVTYSAPVGSVDLEGEGGEIYPCHDCLPWHVEIVRDREDPTSSMPANGTPSIAQFQGAAQAARPPEGD